LGRFRSCGLGAEGCAEESGLLGGGERVAEAIEVADAEVAEVLDVGAQLFGYDRVHRFAVGPLEKRSRL
jgi:hypothetical protein